MFISTRPGTILLMFSQLMRKYRKDYLYISQEKMLFLLAQYHNYSIKRRMLNYRLAELEAAGLIKRTKRNKKHPGGHVAPMTSLLFLTRRAHRLISRLYKGVLRALNKDIRDFFAPRVQLKDDPGSQALSREDKKEKARELAATLA